MIREKEKAEGRVLALNDRVRELASYEPDALR